MSYNHSRSQVYVPSYSSQNTGAAYMARRGWGNESEQVSSISFTSKSSSKRIYVTLFILLILLLIAAIVIIILFASGVFTGADPLQNPTPPYPSVRPPMFPTVATPGPPIFSQTMTYSCSFTLLRQASETFEMKNTSAYYSAFNLIQSALDNVIVNSLIQYAAKAALTDLQNKGNDLTVLFRITMPHNSNVDQNVVTNVIRTNVNQLQSQLGGNAQIDLNTIFVFRLFANK